MTLAVSATPDIGSATPRILVTIVSTNVAPNAVDPSAVVQLFRIDPDGVRRRVITEVGKRLSGGGAVIPDYHAPFNKQVNYVAVFGAVSVSTGANTSPGYWNYAPPPNILPSAFAACGRAGDPVANGWWGDYSTQTAGTGLRAGAMVATIVAGRDPIQLRLGALGTTQTFPHTPGAQISLSWEIQELVGNAMTWSWNVRYYDAGGAFISGEGSGSYSVAANSRSIKTYTTGPAPAGTVSVDFTTGSSTHPTNPASVAIWQICMQYGTGTAIPAAVFIASPYGPTTLVSSRSWLIDPVNPARSVQIDAVSDIGDVTRESAAALHWPTGARYPIAINEGARRARAGQLIIRSDSPNDLASLDALLNDGGPLLMNLANDTGWWDAAWSWIQPGTVTYSNPAGGGLTSYPYRHVAIPYQCIDTPAGSAVPVWTWSDVVAQFATWDAFVAAFPTWNDAAVNNR